VVQVKKWKILLTTVLLMVVFFSSLFIHFLFPLELAALKWSLLAFSVFALLGNLFLIRSYLKEKLFNSLWQTQFRESTSLVMTLLLVIAIFSLLNFIILKNNFTFDLTQSKLHAVSTQTVEVLKNLPDDLNIKFFDKREKWDFYFDLLKQLQIKKKNIYFEGIDIDDNPLLIKKYQVSSPGEFSISYLDRQVQGVVQNELDLTNLLLTLFKTKNTVIGFTLGHGEMDFGLESGEGGAYLKKLLFKKNYSFVPVDLLKENRISSDINVLLVIGPQKGFLEFEINKIIQFLEGGGSLLFSISPNFDGLDWSATEKLLSFLCLIHENALVVDRLSEVKGVDATTNLISLFNRKSRVVANLDKSLLLPLSTSFSTCKKLDQFEIISLFESSQFPASWGEKNLADLVEGKATFTQNEDLEGPLSLGFQIKSQYKDKSTWKAIVLSSAYMFKNSLQNYESNFQLFFNALNWLDDQESLLSLSKTVEMNEKVFISDIDVKILLFFSFFLGLILLWGYSFWLFWKGKLS
jgi:hypothetical protein